MKIKKLRILERNKKYRVQYRYYLWPFWLTASYMHAHGGAAPREFPELKDAEKYVEYVLKDKPWEVVREIE